MTQPTAQPAGAARALGTLAWVLVVVVPVLIAGNWWLASELGSRLPVVAAPVHAGLVAMIVAVCVLATMLAVGVLVLPLAVSVRLRVVDDAAKPRHIVHRHDEPRHVTPAKPPRGAVVRTRTFSPVADSGNGATSRQTQG